MKKMKDESTAILKEALEENILQKLQQKKQELLQEEEKRKKEEEERKRQEALRKEKSKSFEELLAESDLDWRKYK